MALTAAFRLLSESIRNWAEVTMRSPARTPSSTWMYPSASTPRVTSLGWNFPSPRSTTTILRSPDRITACTGTTADSSETRDLILTFAYMSGFSSRSGLSKTIRILTVRVLDSRKG